jgi:hypothetical protein
MRKDNTDDLFLSKRERCKQAKQIRIAHEREEAFAKKDEGYAEALNKINSVEGWIEMFFGYVEALGLSSTGLCSHLALLLNRDHNVLKQRIEYILCRKIKDLDDIIEALRVEGCNNLDRG